MRGKDEERLPAQRSRSKVIYEHGGMFSPENVILEGKAERYSSSRDFARAVLLIVLAVLIIAALLVIGLTFFRVKTVEFSKESDYSNDEVNQAALSLYGKNLLFLDDTEVRNILGSKLHFAEEIEVKKAYPSKLRITVKRGEGKYYTAMGSYYYIIDGDFDVISKTQNREEIELSGLIHLESGKISRCILGKKLSFRDIDMADVLEELLTHLESHALIGFCTGIDIDSKFDIAFMYQDRIEMRLGDLYDLDIKFEFLKNIMNNVTETDSGIIDLSDRDLSEAVVTLYR